MIVAAQLVVIERRIIVAEGQPAGTAAAVDKHMREHARGRRWWATESPLLDDDEDQPAA